MSADVLARYLDRLCGIRSVESIRIGTKALSFWPHRFVTDPDADELLKHFERVVSSGRHLAVMAHFSHPNELRPRIVESAVRRIQSSGAVIRCQAPLIRGVNDDPAVWVRLWNNTTRLGMVPYYLFVEARDPDLVGQPFFAGYDPKATWLTDLKPAFGSGQFLAGVPAGNASAARNVTSA